MKGMVLAWASGTRVQGFVLWVQHISLRVGFVFKGGLDDENDNIFSRFRPSL